MTKRGTVAPAAAADESDEEAATPASGGTSSLPGLAYRRSTLGSKAVNPAPSLVPSKAPPREAEETCAPRPGRVPRAVSSFLRSCCGLIGLDDSNVIPERHPIVARWDAFIMLILIFQTWTIPFEIGVAGGHLWGYLGAGGVLLGESLNVVFLIDTLLYFFRARRDERGYLVASLNGIASKYATGWFVPDLLSCVPVDLVAYLSGVQYHSPGYFVLQLLQMFRLLRLGRVRSKFAASKTLVRLWLRFSHGPVQVFQITLTFLYCVHVMACVWCFTANMQDGKTWVDKYVASNNATGMMPIGDSPSNVADMYVLALYWAAVTMVSLGYGDITPSNRTEYVVAAFLVMISACVWAWVVASFVNLVGTLERARNELRERLAYVNRIAGDMRPAHFLHPRAAPRRARHQDEEDEDLLLEARRLERESEPSFQQVLKANNEEWTALMDETRWFLQTRFWRTTKSRTSWRLEDATKGVSSELADRVMYFQANKIFERSGVALFAEASRATKLALAKALTPVNFAPGERVPNGESDEEEACVHFVMFGVALESELVDPRIMARLWARDAEAGRPPRKLVPFRLSATGAVVALDNLALRLRRGPETAAGTRETSTTIVAQTFCETLALSRAALAEVAASDPKFARALEWRALKLRLRAWARGVLRTEPLARDPPALRRPNRGEARRSSLSVSFSIE